ncbi:hypothetical protein [Lysobacter gummosus]|uniref:hypothetical protein n=1 Tax=Lysobacter gummosus TaxID=262324 RepID=UPI00363155DC
MRVSSFNGDPSSATSEPNTASRPMVMTTVRSFFFNITLPTHNRLPSPRNW